MNRIVLILITIVLVAIAAFAALWFRVGGELQDLAEEVLAEWREGRAGETYASSSSSFRAGRTLAQYRAYLDHWSERLGAFVQVSGRRSVSTSSGSGGTRKSVTLDLQFERGQAEGRFDFVPFGDELKLAHLSLRTPRDPVARDERSGLQDEARLLFRYYDELALVDLYAALSADLQQAWPPQVIGQQVGALHARVGRITKAELRSEEQPGDDLHKQTYGLTFERGKGSAEVEWFWRSQRWEIAAFTLNAGS